MMMILKISNFQKSIKNGIGIVRPNLKNWVFFERIVALLLEKRLFVFAVLRFTLSFLPFLDLLHV